MMAQMEASGVSFRSRQIPLFPKTLSQSAPGVAQSVIGKISADLRWLDRRLHPRWCIADVHRSRLSRHWRELQSPFSSSTPAALSPKCHRRSIAWKPSNSSPAFSRPAILFPTGIQMIGDELPQPLASEFRRCYDQHSSANRSRNLKDMSSRIESQDFAFFVTAVMIQRQTGGDLSEVLGNISGMIRSRIRLAQQVKSKPPKADSTWPRPGRLPRRHVPPHVFPEPRVLLNHGPDQ